MVTLLHAAQLSNYCGPSGHMTLLIVLILWQVAAMKTLDGGWFNIWTGQTLSVQVQIVSDQCQLFNSRGSSNIYYFKSVRLA